MKHRFMNMMCRRFGKADIKRLDKTDGYYDDDGIWVPGEEVNTPVSPAALLPLTDDELAHDGGGTYSVDDRKLICYETLVQGQEMEAVEAYGTRKYTVFGKKGYDDYAPGLHIYILRKSGESED